LNSYQSGKHGEDIALKYLLQQNLILITKNFHSRFGEIDLIMKDHDTLVFIEVRKRLGGIDAAIASITPAKQRKLVKAAQYYLVKVGYDVACRFDAIVMDSKQNIQWLKNIIFL
jgi:putative endonuclease